MKRKVNSVPCSDWQLGWGYGGYTYIGRLSKIGDNQFFWKGSSHGRHGQIWDNSIKTTFEFVDNEIKILEGKILPCISEIMKAIDRLNQIS